MMRTTGNRIATMAVAAGLALSLGACSITIGDGDSSSGASSDGTTQTTDTTQTTSSNSGSDSSGGTSGTGSTSAGTGSGTSSGDASSGTSATPAPAAEMSILGHWECVTVWANGFKLDAKDEEKDENYYDFYADGTVLCRSGRNATPVVMLGEYNQVGTTGTITYENISDGDNEVLEISRTSDGTGLVMKINTKRDSGNFCVYKRTGDAPALDTNPDSSLLVGGVPTGSQGGSDASTSTGTSGSISSGSSSGSSDTPAPGTVVDGWEWV